MGHPNQARLAAHTDIRRSMFVAGDKRGHTLAWGDVAQGWMLENPTTGLIRVRPNLIAGLSDLERVSGINAADFALADNPYL